MAINLILLKKKMNERKMLNDDEEGVRNLNSLTTIFNK